MEPDSTAASAAAIKAAEQPLRKIFSSDFHYVIPSYQRPARRQKRLLEALKRGWELEATAGEGSEAPA